MFGEMPDEVINSFENEYLYGGDYSGGDCGYSFTEDKNYYHIPRRNLKIEAETDKAYLLRDSEGIFWIPKSLIHKDKIKKKGTAYIWHGFTYNYLKENNEDRKQ